MSQGKETACVLLTVSAAPCLCGAEELASRAEHCARDAKLGCAGCRGCHESGVLLLVRVCVLLLLLLLVRVCVHQKQLCARDANLGFGASCRTCVAALVLSLAL